MAGIREVANLAGVSISTVSNVMNNRKFVREDLREKVLSAAKKLDYEADAIARGLKACRTRTLGVIIKSFNRIFFPQVLNGMQVIANELGYTLITHSTDDDYNKEKDFVKMLINNRVDGIVISTVADPRNDDYFKYLSNLAIKSKRVPVISEGHDLTKYGIHSVFVDNYLGGRLMTQHLTELGAREIVHIGGPVSSEMFIKRFQGYKDVLMENGIPFRQLLTTNGDFSPLSGYTALKRLIVMGIPFDAVFADNDQMAIGAMKCLKENNFDIPNDIKLAGFDNTFVASIIKPSLTTIHVPKHKLGALSIKNLIDVIEGNIEEGRVIREELPVELICRQSTCPDVKDDWDLEYW